MTRPSSKVAPDWWDYTTLDGEILRDAANLTAEDLGQLSRDGFEVVMYDSLREFYCAEAFVQHRGHPYPTFDLLNELFGAK